MLRAMKEKTATTVNMMVGISITTAEPTFVPKKEIVAIQPLQRETPVVGYLAWGGVPSSNPTVNRGMVPHQQATLVNIQRASGWVEEEPWPEVQEKPP